MQVSGFIMDPICDLRLYEPKLFSRALHCGSAIFEAGTLNLAEGETITYAVYFHSIIYQNVATNFLALSQASLLNFKHQELHEFLWLLSGCGGK